MKKVVVILALLVMSGISSATLLHNGDFEGSQVLNYDGGTMIAEGWAGQWNSLWGWGKPSSVTMVTEGDNTYVKTHIDNGGGQAWIDLQEGYSTLAVLGASAGDTITLSADIIALPDHAGDILPFLRITAFSGGSNLGTQEELVNVTSEWATYSMEYVIPAGADKLKISMGVNDETWSWTGAHNYGFDNASVAVPEPATMALLGLGGLLLRRRK